MVASRRFGRLVCVVASSLILGGCVALRPLDLSAGGPELREGEGILLLHVDTQVPVSAVLISGARALKQLEAGEHFVFVALPEGDYHWSGVRRSMYWVGRRRFLEFGTYVWKFGDEHPTLRFHVEPGVINYAGMLSLEGWRSRLAYRVANRSARALGHLEEHHPELLERYSARYAGEVRDDFVPHYLEAKRIAAREAGEFHE